MDKDLSYKIMLFANDDSTRAKGLMHTEKIPDDHCALFTFPTVGDHSFWNHNVSYPLSIAFCDSDCKVLAINKMEAMSKEACRANNPNVKYVIETPFGAMAGVKKGDEMVVDTEKMEVRFISSGSI